MLQRTTISLNQDYLNYLKFLTIQRKRKLSELVNEAIRLYLSNATAKKDNKDFFDNLAKLKRKLKINKSQLKKYIEKGRL